MLNTVDVINFEILDVIFEKKTDNIRAWKLIFNLPNTIDNIPDTYVEVLNM